MTSAPSTPIYPVTVADVQAELPTLELDETSQPNVAQAAQMVADIADEVAGVWEAAGGLWPPDPQTTAWAFIRVTALEGARWRILRAKFALVLSAAASPDIALAQQAYQFRLQRLPQLARSGIGTAAAGGDPSNDGPTASGNQPAAGLPDAAARLWPSFAEWSEAQVFAEVQSVPGGLLPPAKEGW